MKRFKLLILFALAIISVQAQIGYQVAIIDQSTGKPKANETISVNVTLTNNEGSVICTETQSVTTNEVGLASLQVGNSTTFDNVDWSKLPFWVSAQVGGITIAKSQILSVPIAEYAKHTGVLNYENIVGMTYHDNWHNYTIYFYSNKVAVLIYDDSDYISNYTFEIDGNFVLLHKENDNFIGITLFYFQSTHTFKGLQ